jgi:Uncharacterized protein conserved in bacteria (DUF2252)
MDIVKATSAYEAWLGELTDVQTKAVARKHSEMAQDAFHLLRATFYRWVEHWETLCPELHSRNDHGLLAVGDLHVENFGVWLDSRQLLVWGINDFDEACELPFTSDLTRLATSIALATDEEFALSRQEICKLLLDGYRQGLKAGGTPVLVYGGNHPELEQLAAKVTGPTKFWTKKLNREDNPTIDSDELPRRVHEMFRASFPRGARAEYRRQRKPGGLGSLGRRRFTALVTEGAACEAREAKALVPSALYWWEKRDEMLSQTGTLLQRAIRSPDPHFQIHDKWLVRRIAPDAVKINLPAGDDSRGLALAPALLQLMGFESANIHLGTSSPDQLAAALDELDRELGARWLENAAERMEEATQRDFKDWTKYFGQDAKR